MKRLLGVIVFMMILSAAMPATAIDSWGEINSDFSYDRLNIKKDGNKCTLSGIIKNETGETRDGVYISFYAYDNFDKLQWKVIVFINAIQGNGSYQFSERISDCKDSNPYKFTFKVTG